MHYLTHICIRIAQCVLCLRTANMTEETSCGNNLAAVLQKKKDIQIENRPIPEPGRNEVQIRMQSVAVCATDIHFWELGAIGDIVIEKPLIQGHECSGVVSKVGKEVTNVKVGDRVAIEPLRICRRCDACVSGRYNLCMELGIFSKPPCDGGLVQYLVQDSGFVHKIPDNVSFDEAALVEPLSVSFHSCGLAKVTAGDNVLITGAGPIGICVLMAAKACGATSVVITDLDASRLEFAKKMGATHTLQISKDTSVDEAAKQLSRLSGRPVSKAIECCGAESAVQLAAEVVKPGGKIVLVGLGPADISIPAVKIIFKEIEIIGCVGFTQTYPTAIEMISSGKCNVGALITNKYTLQETQKAFEATRAGTEFRGIVHCNPE